MEKVRKIFLNPFVDIILNIYASDGLLLCPHNSQQEPFNEPGGQYSSDIASMGFCAILVQFDDHT